MKELSEYRTRLLARLEEAVREFAAACRAREPFAPVAGSDWNVHQIACHARDVDKFVYGMRIHRTLRENDPVFQSFDPDGWMEKRYQKDEPLNAVLDEFLQNAAELCAALVSAPPEVWSRTSSHETLGKDLTLQLRVERSLAHVEEHLKALK